jgi:ferredoxin-nitrite reductase
MLQAAGLASHHAEVDHLRNILASPTAGIDPHALLDTRPLVTALDSAIAQHEEFSGLPAKFSVGFDGGEAVSVRNRRNDLWFVATADRSGTGGDRPVSFRLVLHSGQGRNLDTGLLLRPEACVPAVVKMAQVYLAHVDRWRCHTTGKKPRLGHIFAQQGTSWFHAHVGQSLPGVVQDHPGAAERSAVRPPSYRHIGIHPQRQPGFSYCGVVLPLGRLGAQQLQALAHLADVYGSGTLRLTPWQNVLIPDIPDPHVPALDETLATLGFHRSVTHPWSALVACTGSTGCRASATQTTRHAHELADTLAQYRLLDQPVNIHLSGCPKSCAQQHPSDIALLGCPVQQGSGTVEGYQIYVGAGESPFGRVLHDAVPAVDIPDLIGRLLHVYRQHRRTPEESFGAFADRYSMTALQHLCNTSQPDKSAEHDELPPQW